MRCVTHAEVKASRQCTRCQRPFCGVCVKQMTIGERVLDLCITCNAPLGPIAQTIRPARSLRDLVLRPFTVEGLITAAALGWLAAAFGWMPGIGNFMRAACMAALIAYYFQIIQHVGDGKAGLPGPSDAMHSVGEIWRQTVRGWLCVFAATLPFIVWNNLLHDGDQIYSLPIAIVLLGVGVLYLPAAIVSVALTDSWVGAVYPVAWVQIVKRAPRSYLHLLAVFVLSLGALFALATLGTLALGWIPVVGKFAIATAVNLGLFAQAAIVGGFLLRHAEDFGYG